MSAAASPAVAQRWDEIKRLTELIRARGDLPPGWRLMNALLEASRKEQLGEELGTVEIQEADLLALLDILRPVFNPAPRRRGRRLSRTV